MGRFLNSKDLKVKFCFNFVPGFFCSLELPSRLNRVPKLCFFLPRAVFFFRSVKDGCGIPFGRAKTVQLICEFRCQRQQTVHRNFWGG